MLSNRRIRVTVDTTIQQPDQVSEPGVEVLDQKMTAPTLVAASMKFLEERPTEEFWVIALDSRNISVGMYRVSIGTLSTTLVHPREVFAPAMTLGTVAAMIIVHNHPSGDPWPSALDLELTKRLRQVGELLGISVIDHIIIGTGGRFCSIRDTSGWGPLQ